jgi:hypothetical protein
LTSTITEGIATKESCCQQGHEILLRQTFIPLPTLLEKSQAFCDTTSCSFLALPNGQSSEWGFLSRFGVGVAEDMDFYLWILEQPCFKVRANVGKAKNLYE